ncbi:MAG TPA: alpha/beta hydrolase [Acidimicrobiales bacterium]|nr:alpha/beta hydrolase [Acidimicrobiales bacterium]
MQLAEPDRAGFVEVNRTRLRVWEWGDPADPPVICAHGAHDHGRMWDDFAPRLARLGYRVVAPDLRGHGDSGRVSSGHVWSSSALDLALLARHLGPPVGMVGHSFGGGQVGYVAAVWPELVRWVVNLDGLGPPAGAFEEADLVEMATRSLQAAHRALSGAPRVYPTLDDMAERRAQVNVRLPRPWLDHLVVHGASPVDGGYRWKTDPMFGAGIPDDFSLDHLRAELSGVTCPVLVLTGAEHDTWSELTPEQVEERLAWMPNARHHVIPGAGHYVHVEAPEAVFAEVASFLREVRG